MDEWASVEQEFQPWHESKPELRARVIDMNGAVHWLEPKTIADSPAEEFDEAIFSDRRVIRAPLPAVAVGSVIEYEITLRETAPLLDAGEARRITIYDGVPIQHFQLSLSAPKSIPIQVVSKLIPDSAIHRRETPGAVWECDWRPLDIRKDLEGSLPFDVPNFPYIAFSTGKSWQQVAARYEAIVDQQTRSGDLSPLVQNLDHSEPPLALSAQIAARLHKQVRYTGLEFGESEIVPHTPDETLKRNYGDCKDKASLLVAALRSVGLKSYVALLSAGFDTDVDPSLPGLGVFNHAIVYVASDPPIWIDATSAETRVADLPPADQGRLALIASHETSTLLKTPEFPAENNRSLHIIEMHMSAFGPGEIHEVLEARGSSEAHFRKLYDGSDAKKTKEELERYVKRDFLAKSLDQFSVTSRSDFTQQFKLQLTAKQARRAFTAEDEAVAVIFPSLVLRNLPYPLLGGGLFESERPEKKPPRKNDFVFSEPHVVEYHYKIFPPPSFQPKELPRSIDLKIGTAEFNRDFKSNPDGTVDAVFRFNSGKRRLTASEFQELRDALEPYSPSSANGEMVRFVSEASEDVALGEITKALKLVTASAASQREDLGAQVRLSRMLVTAGAVDAAVNVAHQVVQKDPSFSQGWQALAWAHQFDSFGRRFRGNWNFAESERSLREALRLDPDDIIPKVDLAILLETDPDGVRYSLRAKLDEAINLYREVEKVNPAAGMTQNLLVDLIFAGRYADAREELKKMQGQPIQAAFSTALTAITEDSARAIIDSQSNSPDERMRFITLIEASSLLMQLRRYSQSRDLLKAASRLQNAPEVQSRMDMLSKMKRYDTDLYPESDPRYPVAQAFLVGYSANANLERLKPFFTPREDWTSLQETFAERWRKSLSTRNLFLTSGFSEENVLDAAISSMESNGPTGTDSVYRITADSSLGPLPVSYVVKQGEQYKILGTSDSPDQIGERVLQLLEQQEIKSAQAWLDLVVQDLQGSPASVPGATVLVRLVPASRYLWSGVVESTRGPAAIRAAAASLIGPYTGSPKAIRILNDARAHAGTSLERGQIDLALCQSYARAKNWDEFLSCARRLQANHTFEREGFRFAVDSLTAQENWRELQVEAERKLKTSSSDSDALLAMATSLIHLGQRERASQYLKTVTDSPYSGQEELLLEAWNALLNGQPDSGILEKFNRWTKLPETDSANYWYTLGILQAYLNLPDDAQRSLLKALDADDRGASSPKPWVLASKIYELYSLPDACSSALQKAVSLSPADDFDKWVILLLSSKTRTQSAAP